MSRERASDSTMRSSTSGLRAAATWRRKLSGPKHGGMTSGGVHNSALVPLRRRSGTIATSGVRRLRSTSAAMASVQIKGMSPEIIKTVSALADKCATALRHASASACIVILPDHRGAFLLDDAATSGLAVTTATPAMPGVRISVRTTCRAIAKTRRRRARASNPARSLDFAASGDFSGTTAQSALLPGVVTLVTESKRLSCCPRYHALLQTGQEAALSKRREWW